MLVTAIPWTLEAGPALEPFEVEALLLTRTGVHELVAGSRQPCRPLQELWEAEERVLFHLSDDEALCIRAGAGRVVRAPALFLELDAEVTLSFTSFPHFTLTAEGWQGVALGGPYATLEVLPSLLLQEPKLSRRPPLRPSSLA